MYSITILDEKLMFQFFLRLIVPSTPTTKSNLSTSTTTSPIHTLYTTLIYHLSSHHFWLLPTTNKKENKPIVLKLIQFTVSAVLCLNRLFDMATSLFMCTYYCHHPHIVTHYPLYHLTLFHFNHLIHHHVSILFIIWIV